METYYNKNGKPMLRSCGNCRNFSKIGNQTNMGYCKLQKTMFAYTMEETVYDIKMCYYLCGLHKFTNEEWLMENSVETVDMRSVLKPKEEL